MYVQHIPEKKSKQHNFSRVESKTISANNEMKCQKKKFQDFVLVLGRGNYLCMCMYVPLEPQQKNIILWNTFGMGVQGGGWARCPYTKVLNESHPFYICQRDQTDLNTGSADLENYSNSMYWQQRWYSTYLMEKYYYVVHSTLYDTYPYNVCFYQ